MEIKKKIVAIEEIKTNKPKVQIRQTLEVKKIVEKKQIKDEKKQVCRFFYLKNWLVFKFFESNKKRIDNAIENYKERPKVERDEGRTQQKTASHIAKMGKELDKVCNFVSKNS